MAPAYQDWDMFLRGAAASVLLVHVVRIAAASMPVAGRVIVAGFVASVMAYLVCSHRDFGTLVLWVRVPVLSMCLLSTPLIWLTVRALFDDGFGWSLVPTAAVGAALTVGWMAYGGVGGKAVQLGHNFLMVGFAAAALWGVIRNWQTDLVSSRRALRMGVTGILALYVAVVVSFEWLYAGELVPAWLEMLHLGGIGVVATAMSWVMVWHPLEQWAGSTASPIPLVAPVTATILISPKRGPDVVVSTPLPELLDRKAALRLRLLQAMSEGRAYAQESLTLAQLANQLDASPAQAREAINQGLGYRNFNDFLHHYRINEASQRLLRQDLPILSIALDVGYGSIGPFNRAFKTIKGLTPSEFRAQGSKS